MPGAGQLRAPLVLGFRTRMSHAEVSQKEVEFVRRSEDVDDPGMTCEREQDAPSHREARVPGVVSAL
jgi:hypothetical protein